MTVRHFHVILHREDNIQFFQFHYKRKNCYVITILNTIIFLLKAIQGKHQFNKIVTHLFHLFIASQKQYLKKLSLNKKYSRIEICFKYYSLLISFFI